MSLSYSTLEKLWTDAGGPSAAAPTAAAIAIAESGGNPSSVQQGQPYGTTGWGLWQITPGNSESQFGVDNALLDPMANARAAVAKFNAAGGFGPWTTYTGGAYLNYLNGKNYSGSTNLTTGTAQTSAQQGPIFQWQMPFGAGGLDMDGLIGTGCIVLGGLTITLGVLVIAATGLTGPISVFAKSYAPVRALSAVQARRARTARQATTEARLGVNTQIRAAGERRLAATEGRRVEAQQARLQRQAQLDAEASQTRITLAANRAARLRQERARARILEAEAKRARVQRAA